MNKFGVKTTMAVSIALPAVAWARPVTGTADARAVEAVLSQYKNAIERLDVTGTEQLFTTEARVF